MKVGRITSVSFLAAAGLLGSAVLAHSAEHSSHNHGLEQNPPAGVHRGSEYYFPENDEGVDTLPQRKAAQLATRDQFKVFTDFQFADRRPESGINFRHKAVDDAGRDYKAVHYDHGNGMAVADVDGDGRLDLYLVTQLGENQLWKNLGGGKFRDITAEAGVGLANQISVAPSFADVDNDGDADLFVTTVRKGNHLFENDGKGRFKDISKEAGLDYVGHSSGAVFFDYDRDGRLDLYLTNIGRYTTDQTGRGGYYIGFTDAFHGHLHPDRVERSILYRNLGKGKFQDVTQQMGLGDEGWAGDASISDFNEDGWPDLYVLNMQGDNHYYVNVEGKKFEDRTAQHFPKTPWGAMGIKVFDFDNDGRADMYLTDMHSDMSQHVGVAAAKLKSNIQWPDNFLQGGADNVFGNAFYHNQGGGKFLEVSDQVGVENYWPWGLSSGDLNADGWQDLFVTASMNYPFRYEVNSAFLNDQGRIFRDSEFILGFEPRRDNRTHTQMIELSCDGEDKGTRPCAGQTGKIMMMTTLGSRSSVIFDLDGDGDLDVVTGEFHAEPQVFLSNLAEKKPGLRYLQVKLQGTESNREGIGARVRVKAGGKTWTQWLDGKSGYLSQSSMPLYFGLGDATAVDSVEVLWPSGKTQTVAKPKLNGQIAITEKTK